MIRKLLTVITIVVVLGGFITIYLRWVRCGTIDGTPVTLYQHHHLRLTFFSSMITAFAVVVALLKDEIRSFWEYVKFEVKPQIASFIIEEKVKEEGPGNQYKAISYEVVLVIENKGSISAEECSISLTELKYTYNQETKELDTSMAQELKWIGKDNNQAFIPSHGGKVRVSVLRVVPDTIANVGAGEDRPPKLEIGGVDARKNLNIAHGSSWVASFMVYSANSSPVKYNLYIGWDGKWENRLEEMKESLKISDRKK